MANFENNYSIRIHTNHIISYISNFIEVNIAESIDTAIEKQSIYD